MAASVHWVCLVLLIFQSQHAVALDNGVAITPPMGFNSYMSGLSGGPGLTKIAEYMVSSGLNKNGYEYINTDEGWELKERDNKTGKIVPNPSWGLDGFTKKLHAMGLKFGIYGAASGVTCGQMPGQLYHEDIDAQTYAEWGVDYLKSDNCASYAMDSSVRFAAMRDALNRTGSRIVLSIEPFSINPDPEQSVKVANLWRIACDIQGEIHQVLNRADISDKWAPLAGRGGWNDPDMINVKNSFTLGENRIYFGLWSIMKSPLLLSADLTKLNSSVIDIVNNSEVIAVNQDPLGVQARKLVVNGTRLPWLVGLSACDMHPSKFYNRALKSTGEDDPRKMKVVPSAAENDQYIIMSSSTNRCLTDNEGLPVLLPCDQRPEQRYIFRQGFHTVSTIVNVASRLALTVGNTTLYSSMHGNDDFAVSDAAYGDLNMTFSPEYNETVCTVRNCQDYDPAQKWYYDPVEQMLRQSTYTASINHKNDGNGYELTQKMPTYRHHCLSHVLSTANVGTVSGVTEIWGGPLDAGAFVVALLNRGQSPTTLNVTWDMLEIPSLTDKFDVRNLWQQTDIHKGMTQGFQYVVDGMDIQIFKLSPTS